MFFSCFGVILVMCRLKSLFQLYTQKVRMMRRNLGGSPGPRSLNLLFMSYSLSLALCVGITFPFCP